jgi:hypothetical protein
MPVSFVVVAAKQVISREIVESISVLRQVVMAAEVPMGPREEEEETSIKSIRN